MNIDFDALRTRMGTEHLSKRLRLQVDHASRYFGDGRGGFHFENMTAVESALEIILKFTGLKRTGIKNALDFKVNHLTVGFERLPAAFNGFKVLHLSDIHLEPLSGNYQKIVSTIQSESFDMCVITGDFRFDTFGDYDKTMSEMKKYVDVLHCEYGIYAILGNHDFIEMVPFLEDSGIRVLLNESLIIKRGNEQIRLCGVDDPHFYGTDDIAKSLGSITDNGVFTLLLAHSPELIADASRVGVDYYLCGHTHGGQICLPGGIPIITNAACKRKYVSGKWSYKALKGYTTTGLSASGVFARFFCQPEIVIHKLQSKR